MCLGTGATHRIQVFLQTFLCVFQLSSGYLPVALNGHRSWNDDILRYMLHEQRKRWKLPPPTMRKWNYRILYYKSDWKYFLRTVTLLQLQKGWTNLCTGNTIVQQTFHWLRPNHLAVCSVTHWPSHHYTVTCIVTAIVLCYIWPMWSTSSLA